MRVAASIFAHYLIMLMREEEFGTLATAAWFLIFV